MSWIKALMGANVHAPPLMGSPFVVVDEISIKGGLHLVHGFKPCFAPFNSEGLVERGSVEALHDPVGLGSETCARLCLIPSG